MPKHQDCLTLFIVGARKGGTTSLYSYVAKHPDFDGILLNRGPMSGETKKANEILNTTRQ